MSLNLSKGGSINLSKTSASKTFYVGLGWPDVNIDLDVTALVLDASGNVLSNDHVCFYNQLNLADGSVKHNGDNRSGSGPGDDESIQIDISKLDTRAEQVAIVVTIHEDPLKTFKDLGTSEPTHIHILENDKTGKELAKYVVTDIAPDATCLQFGAVMKEPDGSWKFQAVGAGGVATLGEVLGQFGVK